MLCTMSTKRRRDVAMSLWAAEDATLFAGVLASWVCYLHSEVTTHFKR